CSHTDRWAWRGSVAVEVALYEAIVFFFQAEDGIRDWSVTGVQTCALPIFPLGWRPVADNVATTDLDGVVWTGRTHGISPDGTRSPDRQAENWKNFYVPPNAPIHFLQVLLSP